MKKIKISFVYNWEWDNDPRDEYVKFCKYIEKEVESPLISTSYKVIKESK